MNCLYKKALVKVPESFAGRSIVAPLVAEPQIKRVANVDSTAERADESRIALFYLSPLRYLRFNTFARANMFRLFCGRRTLSNASHVEFVIGSDELSCQSRLAD